MDMSDLAADDLAELSAGSTSPAALRPLPHIPAVSQSQRKEREVKGNREQLAVHHKEWDFMVTHDLTNYFPQAENVPALCLHLTTVICGQLTLVYREQF